MTWCDMGCTLIECLGQQLQLFELQAPLGSLLVLQRQSLFWRQCEQLLETIVRCVVAWWLWGCRQWLTRGRCCMRDHKG